MQSTYKYLMGVIFIIQLASIPMALVGFSWFGAAVGSHVNLEISTIESSAVLAYLLILLIYLLLFKSPLTAIELNNNPNKQWSKSKAWLYLASAFIAVLIYGFICIQAVSSKAILTSVVGGLGVYCYSIFIYLIWQWLRNLASSENA